MIIVKGFFFDFYVILNKKVSCVFIGVGLGFVLLRFIIFE